jgi:hypothetical protein
MRVSLRDAMAKAIEMREQKGKQGPGSDRGLHTLTPKLSGLGTEKEDKLLDDTRRIESWRIGPYAPLKAESDVCRHFLLGST